MPAIVDIINKIHSDASAEYQARVPLATRDNIATIASPLLTYTLLQNEFLTALINKVALSVIYNKIAKNPLSILKKGSIPLGVDIEEIFTNMASGTVFDPTGSTLLTRVTPDVKTLYHRLNREDQYTVTVSRAQLQKAFTAWSELEKLLESLITTLYSGDTYDEFILMKNLVSTAIIAGEIVTALVTAVTDETTGKALVAAVRNAATYMTFAGSNFNKYSDIKGGTAVKTWTPREDQILLLRADIATTVDVNVLAAAFNMDKASFLAKTIEVDDFGAATNCLALLCDRSFFQVYDNLQEMTEFYNPKGLYWNYFWNHWQTYSYSLFANAVAFVTAAVNITDFDALDDLDGGIVGSATYANANAVKAVLPAFAYANGGAIRVPITAWTDTDTYNAGVAADYTFTGVLGELPYGVTNTGTKAPTIDVAVGAGE